MRACTAEAHVLLDRQRREQIGDLERAADAGGGDVLGSRPAIERPASSIVPLSGGYRPERRLNAVVLPAPFGPIRACNVRSRTVKDNAVDRMNAAEMLTEVARHQRRPFRCPADGESVCGSVAPSR